MLFDTRCSSKALEFAALRGTWGSRHTVKPQLAKALPVGVAVEGRGKAAPSLVRVA